MNPAKKQPMQGSFKRDRNNKQNAGGSGSGGESSSLVNSQIEVARDAVNGDDQEVNVLDFAKGGRLSTGTNRGITSSNLDDTSHKKSRKSIAIAGGTQKACCESGCTIF